MKLQLYYPVKPLFINQKFGEVANLQYYLDNGIKVIGHNGIDFMAKHGQPIYASHDGKGYYEVDTGQGHGVVLMSNEKFDYNGNQAYMKTIYWHMVDSAKEPQYKSPVEGYVLPGKGLDIKAGDLIGYTDSTGLSTGDHLHFGLKPVEQGEYEGSWFNIENANGYYGAIDPAPYLNGLFAQDISHPEAPIIPITSTLLLGMTNNQVKILQRVLRDWGYFKYPTITGYYGTLTQQAVLDFQQEEGIVKFGVESMFGAICGPKTRQAINNLIK